MSGQAISNPPAGQRTGAGNIQSLPAVIPTEGVARAARAELAVRHMQVAAQLCAAHQPLPPEISLWLGHAMHGFLNGKFESLNRAFGIRNRRGGISWRVRAAVDARDAALCELAAQHLGGLSCSAQAQRIRQLSLRYAAGGWRFDKDSPVMPAHYAGTAREYLWRAFKAGAAMPLCLRQLRNILGSYPSNGGPPLAGNSTAFALPGSRASVGSAPLALSSLSRLAS